MRSAIIATVLNEARRIREFLASLQSQTRIPDVIIVTDGGSTDGTQDALKDFASNTSLPFHWHPVPGNRSVGRNEAIQYADADLIAVTDVNILDPNWFERILAPLRSGGADVVAGWYEPIGETPRERAMGLMTVYSLEEIDPDRFVPASRSIAFARAAWERVGGYDERLVASEDTFLALMMRRAGLRFVFERHAIVRCWTPSTVREAYRTYRQYANSDGRARLLGAPQTHYARLYGVYGLSVVLIALGFWWPLAWLAVLAGGLAYALYRARKVLRRGLYSQVPYSILVGLAVDLAQMLGYAAGRTHSIEGVPEAAGARGPSNDP